METYLCPRTWMAPEDILSKLKECGVVIVAHPSDGRLQFFEVFSHDERLREHADEHPNRWWYQGKPAPEAPNHFRVHNTDFEKFMYELRGI